MALIVVGCGDDPVTMTSDALDAAVAQADIDAEASARLWEEDAAEVDPLDASGSDTGASLDAGSVDALTSAQEGWHIVHQDLDEALLSVWGRAHDDLWTVGADKGQGPVVLHGDAEGWTRVVTGTTGDLWWVFGPSAGEVVMVGEGGTLLRYDLSADTLTKLDTQTDATLFGVWGNEEVLWAVGGRLPPEDGPPVLLRIEGEVVTHEALPDGIPLGVLFFKVWGTSPQDVWVIGEEGTQLHFDGESWAYVPVEGAPRLVTLHGDGQGLRVVVGGASNAILLEDTGGGWVDRSPPLSPALNGVFVGSERSAAAGMLGSAYLREEGQWEALPPLPLFVDLHATWIDSLGDAYVAGGGLLSVSAMNRGALVRWGPARSHLPQEAPSVHRPTLITRPPAPILDVIDAQEETDAEAALAVDVGPAPEEDVEANAGDVAGDQSDAGPQTEVQDGSDEDAGGSASDAGSSTGELEDVSDVLEETEEDLEDALEETASAAETDSGDEVLEIEVAESTEEPQEVSEGAGFDSEDSAASEDTVPEVEVGPEDTSDADTGVSDGLTVELGEVTTDLSFTPLVTGQLLEIVQGPQGGVHVEVGVRVTAPPGLGTTLASIDARSFIAGEVVGDMVLTSYALYETPEGYVSWAIPVIFFTNLADPYVDASLLVSIEVSLEGGLSATGTAEVSLVDWY